MSITERTSSQNSTVLVVNAGSSSLKYQLIDPISGHSLAGGVVERIGDHDSSLRHHHGAEEQVKPVVVKDTAAAIDLMIAAFADLGPDLATVNLKAVGHRVVMGRADISTPMLVDDDLLETVAEMIPLAPLHNPANLQAMRVAQERFPAVAHVAVFDTAFFNSLPAVASTYALDRSTAEAYGIRRYGFHGISHQFVANAAARLVNRSNDPTLRQVILHLGNGASASAVVGRSPVDTSMGMTPLEGLVMGTRTGDIDPAIAFHLHRQAAMTVEEIDHLFNHRSGMLGLTGETDMREVHRLIAAGDPAARLALDIYGQRLVKYVGAYAAVMGGIDLLTFTAGVGENDAVLRAEVVARLAFLGFDLDPDRNTDSSRRARIISAVGSPAKVLVIPTNEELAIAEQAAALV